MYQEGIFTQNLKLVGDEGRRQFLYEVKFIEKEKSSQQSIAEQTASPAPIGDVENDSIINDYGEKVNTFGEKVQKTRNFHFLTLPTSTQ